MSAINRATVSFNERPDIKVDGKSKKFEMMTVDGKTFMGIKLGEDSYAKLTNRPGGKYDVTMFRSGGKELPEFPVSVTGALSVASRPRRGSSTNKISRRATAVR